MVGIQLEWFQLKRFKLLQNRVSAFCQPSFHWHLVAHLLINISFDHFFCSSSLPLAYSFHWQSPLLICHPMSGTTTLTCAVETKKLHWPVQFSPPRMTLVITDRSSYFQPAVFFPSYGSARRPLTSPLPHFSFRCSFPTNKWWYGGELSRWITCMSISARLAFLVQQIQPT